jgi:hypothetical protein
VGARDPQAASNRSSTTRAIRRTVGEGLRLVLSHSPSAADRGDAAPGIIVLAAPAARPVHLALLVVNLPPTVQPESAQQRRRHSSTIGHPVRRHKHPIRRAWGPMIGGAAAWSV